MTLPRQEGADDIARDLKPSAPLLWCETLSCGRCHYSASLPKTLRLHNLLGCCSATLYGLYTKNAEHQSCKAKTSNVSQLSFSTDSSEAEDDKPYKSIFNKQKKIFSCDVCSYKSTRANNYKVHQLIHKKVKPFSCDSCSYTSARLACLQSHKLTHTGDYPFKCNICSYKGKTKSHLNTHKIIHTGKKSFKCESCGYECYFHCDMKKHKLIHTSEKPFSCDACDYKCIRLAYLKKHQLVHLAVPPYSCNSCSFTSYYSSNMNRHKTTHTRNSKKVKGKSQRSKRSIAKQLVQDLKSDQL